VQVQRTQVRKGRPSSRRGGQDISDLLIFEDEEDEEGGGSLRGGKSTKQTQLLGPPRDYFGKVIGTKKEQEQYWNYAHMWMRGENLRPLILKILEASPDFETAGRLVRIRQGEMWEAYEVGCVLLELYSAFRDSFFLSAKNVSAAKRWFWLLQRELQAGAHYEMAFDTADRRLAYLGEYSGAAAASTYMRVIVENLERLQDSASERHSIEDMGIDEGLEAVDRISKGYLKQFLLSVYEEQEKVEREAEEQRRKEDQMVESEAAKANKTLAQALLIAAKKEGAVQAAEEPAKDAEVAETAAPNKGAVDAAVAASAEDTKSDKIENGEAKQEQKEEAAEVATGGSGEKESSKSIDWEGAVQAAHASAALADEDPATARKMASSATEEEVEEAAKAEGGPGVGPAGLRTEYSDSKDAQKQVNTGKQQEEAEQVCGLMHVMMQ
jgi:hypothetical protein